MATTTPNFGWDIPQSTDLVKDGATAIAALGTDIDTALVDLKGGTTGQVLSKASNTDLDFTWVAQDDSNAIQNALLTTTGDTIYASAASTPARLGIGSTGQVLTVAGGIPSWATPSSGGMTLISTTTLSGATVTLSSIPQTYNSLFLIITGHTNATADGIFRCAPNGTTNITTVFGTDSSASVGINRNDYIRFVSSNLTLTRTNANNSWSLNIDNYTSSTAYKPVMFFGGFDQSGTNQAVMFSGQIQTNTAISSLVFSNSGGNLSTGTVLLYGVK